MTARLSRASASSARRTDGSTRCDAWRPRLTALRRSGAGDGPVPVSSGRTAEQQAAHSRFEFVLPALYVGRAAATH